MEAKGKIVFLGEDRDDWQLIDETLASINVDARVNFFATSTDFFSFLEKEGLPSLILADYKSLPEDGLSVLKRIKASADWRTIPVVILSDSTDPRYRDACYREGASSFIKKPDNLAATKEKIRTFFAYWMDVVEV